MTVPILPGPFSYIPGLLNAVGSTITAVQDEKEMRRKNAMAKLAQTTQLVNAGVLSPTVFSDPGMAPVYEDAGIPQPTAKQVIPSVGEATARVVAPTLQGVQPGSTEARAVAGLPLESAVQTEALKAKELSGVKPGTAASRAVTNVPSEGLAAGAEQLQGAQQTAGTEAAKFGTTVTQIAEGLTQRNPEFAQLSASAKAGILDYLIEQLRANGYITAAGISAQTRGMADFITKQQTQLTSQIKTVQARLAATPKIIPLVLNKAKVDPTTGKVTMPTEYAPYASQVEKYLADQKQLVELTAQLADVNRMATGRLGEQPAPDTTAGPPSPPPPPSPEARKAAAAALELIRKSKGKLTVDMALASPALSPEAKQIIRATVGR